MAGEDGIPAEWYTTMGARVTEIVYEDEIDRDATPMECLYPSALAHPISDTYTQIHRDGVAPMGMRTAIISLIQRKRRAVKPPKLPSYRGRQRSRKNTQEMYRHLHPPATPTPDLTGTKGFPAREERIGEHTASSRRYCKL